MKQKYIEAFMSMAGVFAQTSEATRLKVGAILVKDTTIISCGVNGTPSGWYTNTCEGFDGLTVPVVRHAEINALNKLRKLPSVSTGATMFCTHACCLNCSIDLVDAEVKQFFYRETYRDLSGLDYLNKHDVEVIKL